MLFRSPLVVYVYSDPFAGAVPHAVVAAAVLHNSLPLL
jgi:hypothetical protein